MKKELEPVTSTTPRHAPRHQLVLLDDDHHTYDYVIEMLGRVCGVDATAAFLLADEVHRTGRAIVYIGPFEIVEFKQELIHGYGRDPRIPQCAGSMTAVIEPIPE